MNFRVAHTTRTYPHLQFEAIKDTILGKRYELSLTFIGSTRAAQLNTEYRNKSYVPNVLSFPLDTKMGEIFITPAVAKKEARKFDLSYNGYVTYLFIHGCLHLKGLDHGPKMDALEEKYKKQFKVY